VGYQGHTENFISETTNFIDAVGQLDPTALAAPAGMYLRLDDPLVAADRLGGCNCLSDGWYS
jgi:hypothetical protein